MAQVRTPDSAELSESLRQRELQIAREIAQAFLSASRPLEVYRLALARVTALVGASFSSVFLRDPEDPSLLRLVCAQNWPQASARFLGQMRIRVGRGPTGRAVAEGLAFDVEDVFAEPGLREWWQPAREMGFTSLMSLPLRTSREVTGALTFYFSGARQFGASERALLVTVTDQLAATAERAHLIERLQAANERLERENAELVARLRAAEEARRAKTEFLHNVSEELRTPLASIASYADMLSEDPVGRLSGQQRATVGKIGDAAALMLRLVGDLHELSQLKLGRRVVRDSAEKALDLAQRAIEVVGAAPAGVAFRLDVDGGSPALLVDADKVVRILQVLLSNAFKFTREGEVVLTVRHSPLILPSEGRHAIVEWEVRDTGIGIRAAEQPWIFDETHQVDGTSTRLYGGTGLGLAVAHALAQLLGGEILLSSEEGSGSTFTLRLRARLA